jgi:hypothetical protein
LERFRETGAVGTLEFAVEALRFGAVGLVRAVFAVVVTVAFHVGVDALAAVALELARAAFDRRTVDFVRAVVAVLFTVAAGVVGSALVVATLPFVAGALVADFVRFVGTVVDAVALPVCENAFVLVIAAPLSLAAGLRRAVLFIRPVAAFRLAVATEFLVDALIIGTLPFALSALAAYLISAIRTIISAVAFPLHEKTLGV